MMYRTAFVLAGVITAACMAEDDLVLRRGVEPPLRGAVSVDDAGVTVRIGIGTGATHFVPWDRVRDVRMDDPLAALESHLKTAEDLWRARTRLERGDAAMAEPLLERLFEQYRGRTHETALVVAEGLLRCRLDRYDLPRAVVPALEVARLRRAGVQTVSYGTLAPLYDPDTSLCMHLPPVWMDQQAAMRMADELARYNARNDPVVAALALLYQQSATMTEIDLALDRETNRHPGVRLLRDLVETRSAEAADRDAARGRLLRDMRSLSGWAEAWARFAVGASLMQEGETSRAELGALQLSHLPARFSQQQPYLAGLALTRLIEVLRALGNDEAVASLQVELARRYAFHPVRRDLQ